MQKIAVQMLLLTLCCISFVWACDDPSDDRMPIAPETSTDRNSSDGTGTQSGNGDDDFAPAPDNILGTYLKPLLDCQFITLPSELGCNAYAVDEEGVRSPLSDHASLDRWEIASSANGFEAKQEQRPGFDVVFQVSGVEGQELEKVILEAEITLTYTANGQDQEQSLKDRVKAVLFELQQRKYFKLVIESVLQADENQPVDPLDSIELLIDGSWVKVDLNLAVGSGKVGNFEVEFKGSLTDAQMLSSFNSGGLKEFTEDSSFAAEAPHDFKAKPVEIIFQASSKKELLQGFRLNNGADVRGLNLPTGTPDDLHFSVSDDGDRWLVIPGSHLVRDDDLEAFEAILANRT